MSVASVIQVDRQSVFATIAAIKQVQVSTRAAGYAAARAAGAVLLTEVRKRAMLTDHSPGDLRKLDHPYARRHGSIQIHTDAPYQVHTRTGRFLKSLKMKAGAAKLEGAASYFDVYADGPPHVAFVIKGTRVMLPRDIIWGTGNEPAVKREMMRVVTLVLGKGLRSQSAIRFGV